MSANKMANTYLDFAGPLMSQYFFWCALDQGYLSLNRKNPPPHLGFTSMLVGSFIWGSYGLSLGAPAMWVPNATGLAVAIVTVFAINDAEPLDPNVLLVMAAIGTTVAFLQLFYGVVGLDKATANAATGYIGNVVGIVMMCSSAVTWPTMASTGDASALEAQAGMVFAGFANAMAWTALGMLKLRDPLVWLPNILGVACTWDKSIAAIIGLHVVVYGVLVQSFRHPEEEATKTE
eukprot:gene1336-22980_t